MKRKIPVFWGIVLFLALSSAQTCRAENVFLGKKQDQDYLSTLPNSISLKVKNESFPLTKSDIITWIKKEPSLTQDSLYLSEIEKKDLCLPQEIILCALTLSSQKLWHVHKYSSLYLQSDLLQNYLKSLSEKVHRDPQNAKLKMEAGKVSVFVLSQKGIDLDIPASQKKITDYLKKKKTDASLTLVYSEIEPEIKTNSIENMGITDLIGEGTSNFAGSPPNRVHNIQVATKRYDGLLIKPGEEFSFIKNLGDVDAEHNYLPELVIKNNKTEPEFGGGICQVSTTIFRAAVYSGLEITARKNHAYPVSYYNPQGMDATVYIPRPDLRFINNTPGYILIQTKIEGTQLTFDFYGTNDGRKTNIIGPKITQRNPDGSMKATFTQEVFDKNGNLKRSDIFNSSYDSPNKYPHPGQEILTEKPTDWSKKQWKEYKKAHGL